MQREKEIKQLVQACIVSTWESQDLNPGSFSPEPLLYIPNYMNLMRFFFQRAHSLEKKKTFEHEEIIDHDSGVPKTH